MGYMGSYYDLPTAIFYLVMGDCSLGAKELLVLWSQIPCMPMRQGTSSEPQSDLVMV